MTPLFSIYDDTFNQNLCTGGTYHGALSYRIPCIVLSSRYCFLASPARIIGEAGVATYHAHQTYDCPLRMPPHHATDASTPCPTNNDAIELQYILNGYSLFLNVSHPSQLVVSSSKCVVKFFFSFLLRTVSGSSCLPVVTILFIYWYPRYLCNLRLCCVLSSL